MANQQNNLLSVPEDLSVDSDDNRDNRRNTTSTLASFFGLGRRRRNNPRPSRLATDLASSSGRASQTTSLRAEAAEFVPSVSPRMPTKRKASSSARPGKSAGASPRANSGTSDQPLIRANDLFTTGGALTQKDGEPIATTPEDDDDHSEILDFDLNDLGALTQNNAQPVAQVPNNLRDLRNLRDMALARTRPMERSNRPTDNLQISSAMLYSHENAHGLPNQRGHSHRVKYLPLGPAGRSGAITKDSSLTILPSYRQRIDNTGVKPAPTRTTWPLNELPKEIFDLITDYLSRDDIKSMRLVCREFEQKVSDTLFNTSVVPFNTELYDMIDEDAKASIRAAQPTMRARPKRKGRARDMPEMGLDGAQAGLQWQNDKDDAEGKVYQGHGLRVFQGFGPHIKRFGMSFEVAEAQLAHPPVKRELDQVESYHGAYDWPPPQYTRFAPLAGLERTADETLRMKAAFANLKKVQELGLSVESGLGWLNGPDKSVFAKIFERPSPVFGQLQMRPSEEMREAKDFWAAIQASLRSTGVAGNPKEISLFKRILNKSISEIPGLQATRFADTNLWPSIGSNTVNSAILVTGLPGTQPDDPRQGILCTSLSQTEGITLDRTGLVPSELRKEQKEWLLETEWAQRAFLESYVLAIIDNPLVVANVRTLNIAKVSSSFLPILGRQSFWDALPNLTDATIHVKPDWRTVEKDNAGFAETRPQNPSEAVRLFHRCILRDRICLRPITKLNIGWVGGGEHGEGIFARNNNLLPAPITQPEHSTAPSAGFGLVFKYVEDLTLHNCWITPPALEELVTAHSDKALKKLTLDSVSLTAHPRFPVGGQPAQNAQAMAALQAGGAFANNQMPAAPALANGQPNSAAPVPAPMMAPNAQQMQNMQQMANMWNALNNLQNHQQMFNQILHPNNPHNPGVAANGGLMNPFPPGFAAANQNAGNNGPLNPAQPPHMHNGQQNVPWSESMREGSWPELLNKISPGPIFSDYRPQPMPWEGQLPERPETTLRAIELKSCGYARLLNNPFDQFAIQATDDHHLSVWFRQRQAALSAAMMTNADRYMGRIVQHIPNRELMCMLLAWGLREGWEDREKAEEPEYDGLLAGGTGRVSGTILKGMPLVSGPAPA